MNDLEWVAYLATLPPALADLAQHMMERINTVLSRDRSRAIDEEQRTARRSDANAERINDLALRLDQYEERGTADIRAELVAWQRGQVSKEQWDQFIKEFHQLAVAVEALKQQRSTR